VSDRDSPLITVRSGTSRARHRQSMTSSGGKPTRTAGPSGPRTGSGAAAASCRCPVAIWSVDTCQAFRAVRIRPPPGMIASFLSELVHLAREVVRPGGSHVGSHGPRAHGGLEKGLSPRAMIKSRAALISTLPLSTCGIVVETAVGQSSQVWC